MGHFVRLDGFFFCGWRRGMLAFAGAAGATLALFAGAGCESAESTGAAAAADQSDTCHYEESSFEWITHIGPTQDVLKGQCVPIDVTPDSHMQVPCLVIEGRSVGAANAAQCNTCTGAGRVPVGPYQEPLVDQMKAENPGANLDCFCGIEQVEPDLAVTPQDLKCQMDPSDDLVDMYGKPIDGFCYVSQSQHIGNPSFVEECPSDEKRLLRFVGAGKPDPSATTYVACVEYTSGPPPASCP